jgi:sigma-E factor negative regulatory protein RseB
MTPSSWSVRSLALLSLLLAVGSAWADDRVEVERWLDRMARAVETLDYRGTLVFWRGDQFDTLKIIHRSDESGIRERLYSLNGQPREILRDGDQVRSLLAGEEPVIVHSQLSARLLPHLPLSRLDSAQQAYAMHVRGHERVAGLQTRVIEILPYDQYRYGHRFWLEQQTGMLLRSALLDRQGDAVQQLTFVEIELGARISDFELEPQIEPEVVLETRLIENPTALDPGSAEPSAWMPSRVPQHFQLARKGIGQSESGANFKHLLYSDGLASFSVYIEEDGLDQQGSRLESLGAVNVYTGSRGGRQVTIVGEVPIATVRLVGQWLQGSGELPDSR